MTSILDNLPPWPQLSFVIATQIARLDMAKSFLTMTELESFTQALLSFDTWKQFISTRDHIPAFRVRAMISEQFIPYLYQHRPCCRSPFDLQELCKAALDIQTPNSPVPMPTTVEPTHTDFVPLLDIYHTLEFDMAAMMEQRKLDEFKAQEEVLQEEESTPTVNISIYLCMYVKKKKN